MDHLGMKAFLKVAECGNISRAAEQLFATSSAVGKRIKQLEKEVGAPLLVRGKGRKHISLTKAGEAFMPLAERWLALWSDMQDVSAVGIEHSLSVGTLESITPPLLVPLFQLLYANAPQVRLRVITKYSLEMYNEIETRRVDIGFTLREMLNPYVVARRLFSEPLVVLRPTRGPGSGSPYDLRTSFPAIRPETLDPDHELFIAWHDNYQLWHDQHWNRSGSRRVILNNCSLLIDLISDPRQWAIVPLSIAYTACKRGSFAIHTLTDAPPPRVCYLLTHRIVKQSSVEAIAIFEKYLAVALKHNIPWASL